MLKLSKTAKIVINRAIWLLTFLVLGILATNQYLLYQKINLISSPEEPQSKALRVSQLYNDNEKLRLQLDTQQNHRDELQSSASSTEDTQQILNKEIEKYTIILGQTAVEGPGVTLSVGHILMKTQLIDLINALKNSGAEAIAINQKRVITTTPMDQFKEKPSYMIQVIGDQTVLYDSLTRPGGILDLVTNGNVEKSDKLLLPGV